jgi:hypothetical protein
LVSLMRHDFSCCVAAKGYTWTALPILSIQTLKNGIKNEKNQGFYCS